MTVTFCRIAGRGYAPTPCHTLRISNTEREVDRVHRRAGADSAAMQRTEVSNVALASRSPNMHHPRVQQMRRSGGSTEVDSLSAVEGPLDRDVQVT